MTAVLETPATATAHRADAWTILGTSVQDAGTARQALEAAHLARWDVRLMGNVTATATDIDESGVTTTTVKMPDTRATVRTNPLSGETEYIGTVGRRYTTVQIEDYADVLDMFRKESGATFHKAGGYDNGRRFFVSMTLPDSLRIGGFDEHQMHLTLFGSHDGSSSNSFHIGPTRLDCGNMQRLIIKGAQHSYTIPHTASAPVKLANVHQALAALLGWQEAFEREANRMLNTPLSSGAFERLVNDVWPVPTSPSKRTRTNFETRMTTLRALFRDADTQESIRGTAWAGWNAIGEYVDHYARANSVSARAARSLSDTGDATRRKSAAYNLLALAA